MQSRTILGAVMMLVVLAALAVGVAPPARLTAEQRALLLERNRLLKRMMEHRKTGELAEATDLCAKALRLQRQVVGQRGTGVVQILGWLAQLEEARGRWSEAEEARREAVVVEEGLHGKEHWTAVDARQELADVRLRARLNLKQQAMLTRANRLHADVGMLRGQGKSSQAIPLMQQVLRLRRDVLGEKHPHYAASVNNLAFLYEATGAYGKALPLYQQALTLHRDVQGEKHPHYAASLNNLASLYRAMGEYNKALPLARQALRLCREARGEKHPHSASLNNLASLYQAMGEYSKAVPLAQQALRLVKEVQGEKHPNYASSLNNLAHLYRDMGEHNKALPLFQQALRLVKEVQGEKHPLYATTLNNLASLYQAMGEYSKALPLARQALNLHGETLGEKHPLYATSLNNLASLYMDLGEHGKALPLLQQVQRLYREVLGEKHPRYARSLTNLATLYRATGEYRKALPLFNQALRLHREVLGEKHPEYANSLNNLASIYQDMGEYSRALPLAQQGLSLFREVLGEKHPRYAGSLNNLAFLYRRMGEYSKALPLAQQALSLVKEVLGEKHPEYATSLNNLAALYRATGQYRKALPLFNQALRLRREVLGAKHRDYANSLTSLATLYMEMGEHGKALLRYQQALRVNREVLGEKHPDQATSLSNLASLYRDMGEHGKALPLAQQALSLVKEVLGEKHPDYALRLNNLATLYWAMGEDSKALPLLQQALRLTREVQGEKHPLYATTLNNLAVFYTGTREYSKALPLLQQALRLRREVLGAKHPEYANSLTSLATLYKQRQKSSAAAVLSGQALAVKLAHVRDTLGAVDDRQRLVLLDQVSFSFWLFLTTATGSDLPPGELYRWVLGVKGVLASASSARLDLIAKDDPEGKLKPWLQQLQSARAGVVQLTRTTPAPGEMASWRERFDRLEASKRQAQEALAQASPEFARLLHRPTAAEVAAALPADSALIEFLSFKYLLNPDHRRAWQWESQLLAFVIRPGRPIELVYLGNAGAFEANVRAWRQPLMARRPAAPDPSAAAWLRKHLWKPVEKHLAGVKTVLIAPDGELANLPFAALPGKEPGSFLLEQYAFGTVPSGRQLLDAPSNKPASGLLALGGVSFGAPPAKGERPTRLWSALPGTTLEAEQVERLFRARFAAATRRLSGTDADRASVLAALTPVPKRWRYLHLATHGYFEPARTRFSPALPAAGLIGVASAPGLVGPLSALANVLAVDDPDILDPRQGFDPSGRSARVHGRNPMLAAGLVLSGANRLDGDGVLTAEEISGLDLRGCSVAVLSACQTALGKQEGYQGVQGLQRAFHDAGCAHLVASLWNVNDVATSVLVEEFYQQLWRHKMSPLQALRLAQLAVLKDPERVRRQAKKLKPLLVKLGVKREELASRGFEDDAVVGKPPERSKGELSPVAWWAAWTVSGRP